MVRKDLNKMNSLPIRIIVSNQTVYYSIDKNLQKKRFSLCFSSDLIQTRFFFSLIKLHVLSTCTLSANICPLYWFFFKSKSELFWN